MREGGLAMAPCRRGPGPMVEGDGKLLVGGRPGPAAASLRAFWR